MSAAVNVNRPSFATIARAAWGEGAPDWVLVLAAESDRITAAAAAKRIGYSGGAVSSVLRAKYPGDLAAVEGSVRGALMGAVVECPVLGEIGRDQCLREQGMPRAATSAVRSRLYHACRSGCPHSRLRVASEGQGGGDGE